MTEVVKRSHLPGELGAAIDRALLPTDDVIYELATYRGQGLVVTTEHLLLVVGGVLAGLKPHEQHVRRLAYDEIQRIEIEPEKTGCFRFLGVPPVNLVIVPVDPAGTDAKWDSLIVDYPKLGAAVRLACEVHERIGRRKADAQ